MCLLSGILLVTCCGALASGGAAATPGQFFSPCRQAVITAPSATDSEAEALESEHPTPAAAQDQPSKPAEPNCELYALEGIRLGMTISEARSVMREAKLRRRKSGVYDPYLGERLAGDEANVPKMGRLRVWYHALSGTDERVVEISLATDHTDIPEKRILADLADRFGPPDETSGDDRTVRYWRPTNCDLELSHSTSLTLQLSDSLDVARSYGTSHLALQSLAFERYKDAKTPAFAVLPVPRTDQPAKEPNPIVEITCDCVQLAADGLDCRRRDWSQFAAPGTDDGFGGFLEDLLEGTEVAVECMEEKESFPGWDALDGPCGDECDSTMWEAFCSEATTTSNPTVRWGSIVLCFARYMDVSPSFDHLDRLEHIAVRTLRGQPDATTVDVMLEMLEFYRFDSLELRSLLLGFMESDRAETRERAWARFRQNTGTNYKFDPHASDKKRDKQLKRLHNWYDVAE